MATTNKDQSIQASMIIWRIQGERCHTWYVDEGRKRALLIADSILAARKVAPYDGGRHIPATVAAVTDAVRWAEEIMREIDRRWPRQESSDLA